MAYQFRQKPETLAKRILQKRITKVQSVVKKCLADFSGKLLEQSLISEGLYDPDDSTRRKEESASVLYSACITAVTIDATNFQKVIHILAEYPLLEPVVQEMEDEGIANGLMTSRAIRKEPSPSAQKQGRDVEKLSDALTDPPTLMKFLENVALEMPAKWRTVGIALGVSSAVLDSFELQYLGNPMRCFEKVFESWKKNNHDNFTWSTLIRVLDTKLIGEDVLANNLRQKLTEP